MFKPQLLPKFTVSLFALSVVMLQTGCGSGGVPAVLSDLQVSSSVQNGDVYATLSTNLSSSGFIISSLNLPIVDPKDPAIEYGQVAISPTVCASGTVCVDGSELSLSINLTEVANLNTGSTTLPNGTAVPLSGLTSLIGLPIGTTGGTVYIDLTSNTAVIGVAFPFAALNGVGAYVPGLDIFDTVAFGNVDAYVGLFAGSAKNQTGIAIFVNASSVIYPTTTPTTTATPTAQALTADIAKSETNIALKPNSNSTYDEYVFLTRMQSLGNRHTVLELK